jgi:very-short-patch-repair endonuclease
MSTFGTVKKHKPTTDDVIENFKKIHRDEFDYSLVDYINQKTKLKIICKKHGIFEQLYYNHLSGSKCPICVNNNIKKDNNTFINECVKIYGGDRFNYDFVEYKNNRELIKIKCNKCNGIFNTNPYNFLKGCGCKICNRKKLSDSRVRSVDEIKKIANTVHNNIYDYSLLVSVNNRKKIKIVCYKHGVFEQILSVHLRGHGCPLCNISKGEFKIKQWLDDRNIKYTQQFKFPDCKNILPLSFDFFLPEYNICIEYDGKQHFNPLVFFGGEEGFKKRLKNDKIKDNYCNSSDVKLIRIRYNENFENKLNNKIFV